MSWLRSRPITRRRNWRRSPTPISSTTLRAKLDGFGYYDDTEVERVVTVELDPRASQAQLVAAIAPVADRLLKRYKALQQTLASAQAANDGKAEKDAKDELAAMVLFKA